MLITSYDIDQVFKFLNIKPYEQFKIYDNDTKIILKNKYCLSNLLGLYKVDKNGILHLSTISFFVVVVRGNGNCEGVKINGTYKVYLFVNCYNSNINI